MRIFLGIDDTDTKGSKIGTGRLARNLAASLAPEYSVQAVLRHQLPKFDDIPYTSNNSSACILLESEDASPREQVEVLSDLASAFLAQNFQDGSDPGLCIACEDAVHEGLVSYALETTGKRMSQKQAMQATEKLTLMGLGGTNDGIIGAAAAVGLTKYGWCGRFIEYGTLRKLEEPLCVGDICDAGIQVVSVDRDPVVPLPGDELVSGSWIRPSLWAGKPVLQVKRVESGVWQTAHGKRPKGQMHKQAF
jgi:tRNA(Ile2) C34 agmatinyltransferase TiaS